MTAVSILTAPYLEVFLLVFFRVAALASVAPLLGHRAVPPPHRVALGLLVAIVVSPALGPLAAPARGSGELLLALGGEVVVGLAIGFVASTVVAAVSAAGELIGFSGGLSLAAAYDPSLGQQSNVVAHFLDVCATLLLLSLNGHHLLLRAVAASFTWLAPGQAVLGAGAAGGLVALGGKVLRSGVELAGPALGLLFVVNVVLALLARVAPQMNVFMVGAPLMVAAALLGLAESLPWMLSTATRLIGEIPGDIRGVFAGAGRGF